MISRANILRESRQDKSVKFLEFMKLYSKNPNQLICFFEGDDAKYFCVRIAILLNNRQWAPINCRGKGQVLELFALVSGHAEYSKCRAGYFVDRDFDPPLSAETRRNVYETPCYSIENFYTSVDCFKRILQSEFGITDGYDDGTVLERCCDLFNLTQKLFHDAITELNAWICLQRNEYKDSDRLNLRGVRLDKFVAIGLGAVNKLYSIPELKEIFPVAPAIDETLLAGKIAEFTQSDRKSLFRGKYEIEFMRIILLRFMDDFRSDAPQFFPRRGNVGYALSRENLVSELSQYADYPNCLKDYLLNLNQPPV